MRTQTLFFLCLALSAQSPQPIPTPAKTGQKIEQARTGESQNSKADEKGTEKPLAPVEILQSTQGDRKSQDPNNNPRDPAPDQWVAWFTGALVVVALLQFAAMFFQALYMRKGLRIALETAQAAKANAEAAKANADVALRQLVVMERQASFTEQSLQATMDATDAAKESARAARISAEALIDAESAWVVVSVSPPNWKPPSDAGAHEFRFDLENCGKTIARLTGPYRCTFHLLRGGDELPPTPNYGYPADTSTRMPPEYGRLLPPGENNGDITSCCWIMTDETFESVQNRTAKLYFYASLTYFDFADRETELQFCYLYVPKSEDAPDRWVLSGPKGYNRHTRRRQS